MSSIWTVRRSATDSKLTGLCGGVARHWGVDPVLVRVGAVLLALSGGIGIVLYAAGWLLIPVEGKDRAPVDDFLGEQARKWPKEAWIIIVVVACIVMLTVFGSVIPFGFGPAVILAAIWYFGYYKNRPSRTEGPSFGGPGLPGSPSDVPGPHESGQQHQFYTYPGPSTPFTEAAKAWQQRVEEQQQRTSTGWPPATNPPSRTQQAGRQAWPSRPAASPSDGDDQRQDTSEPVGPAASLPPVSWRESQAAFLAAPDPVGLYGPEPVVTEQSRPARRAIPPSAKRLRLVSLLVLGLTLSGLGIADRLGVNVTVSGYFAAALLVVGLTLIAATWFGRARGLLFAGFALLVAVVSTSVGGPVAEQRAWGSHPVTYTTIADLPTTPVTFELADLRVDMSSLAVTRDVSYTAHVRFGNLEVTVPAGTQVRVNYSVDNGMVTLYDREPLADSDLTGMDAPVNLDPKKPTLTLNLSVDAGELQVHS